VADRSHSEGTGTQLDISTDPYAVVEFSSPAPPLETSMAGTIDTEGDLIAARRHQNRQVSFTVEVVGTSQANLDASVATLEAKVAELAREGGTFRRVRADGTYRTADILAADQFDKAFRRHVLPRQSCALHGQPDRQAVRAWD
jgi:hypothetical protein